MVSTVQWPTLERDINTAINKTTGKSPFELLYGYFPRFSEDQTRLLTIGSETYKIPEDLRREIREKIELEQKNVKSRYDKTCLNNVKFNVGNIVYVKGDKIATGE